MNNSAQLINFIDQLMRNAEKAIDIWHESGSFLLSADQIDAIDAFIEQDSVKKIAQPGEIIEQWDRWERIRSKLESLGKEALNQVFQFKTWHRYSINCQPKKTT